jgi:hypothetical protein
LQLTGVHGQKIVNEIHRIYCIGITVLGHAPDEEEDEIFVSVGETVRYSLKEL